MGVTNFRNVRRIGHCVLTIVKKKTVHKFKKKKDDCGWITIKEALMCLWSSHCHLFHVFLFGVFACVLKDVITFMKSFQIETQALSEKNNISITVIDRVIKI